MTEPGPKPREGGRREIDDLALARAQAGDAPALRSLVEHYSDLVFGYLGRMFMAGRRDARVEDAAQDTFLRVLQSLHRFDRSGGASLSTWILTIATNRAIDELRRAQTRKAYQARAPELRAVHPSSAVTRSVYRAVEALPPDRRAAFLLHELCDLTYREVAEALGAREGTIKSRVARARAQLRAALEECDE